MPVRNRLCVQNTINITVLIPIDRGLHLEAVGALDNVGLNIFRIKTTTWLNECSRALEFWSGKPINALAASFLFTVPLLVADWQLSQTDIELINTDAHKNTAQGPEPQPASRSFPSVSDPADDPELRASSFLQNAPNPPPVHTELLVPLFKVEELHVLCVVWTVQHTANICICLCRSYCLWIQCSGKGGGGIQQDIKMQDSEYSCLWTCKMM